MLLQVQYRIRQFISVPYPENIGKKVWLKKLVIIPSILLSMIVAAQKLLTFKSLGNHFIELTSHLKCRKNKFVDYSQIHINRAE